MRRPAEFAGGRPRPGAAHHGRRTPLGRTRNLRRPQIAAASRSPHRRPEPRPMPRHENGSIRHLLVVTVSHSRQFLPGPVQPQAPDARGSVSHAWRVQRGYAHGAHEAQAICPSSEHRLAPVPRGTPVPPRSGTSMTACQPASTWRVGCCRASGQQRLRNVRPGAPRPLGGRHA